jgi:uncharacterized protein (DUF2164 family)
MDVNKKLLERIDHVIELSNLTLTSKFTHGTYRTEYVKSEIFKEFETSALSFILNLYGISHPFYINFSSTCNTPIPSNVERGRGVLRSIKTEIERGWLTELKTLVSAEIFSDFLEMGNYFLEEGYKDAAAVMIGSVLEENLRQIAQKNSVDITFTNGSGDVKPKKADTINADLVKANVYNILDQKQITAWLDLRNKAAHGEYEKYDLSQVQLMYQGVLNFIIRLNN